MKIPEITFRQITFQKARIDRQVINLFTDDCLTPAHDILKLGEQALINWLLSDPSARGLLLELLEQAPDAFCWPGLQEPFYGPKEGDIDLLVCDKVASYRAAAIECKRVKVNVIDDGNDWINKLEEVGEGVWQAKKLYKKFGFFQTYFAIISAVNSANRKQVNIPNRGVTPESVSNWDSSRKTFRSIVEFPRREELPADIGIIFIEMVQPSGRAFEEQGIVRICVHHPATPRTQRRLETNKIQELMKRIP